MSRGKVALCLLALAAAGCAAGPPVIDGVVAAGEWRGAQVVAMGSAHGYFARRDGALYIGVDDKDRGIGTILIGLGARVYVLHTSAAIATATYERAADGAYRRVRDFAYACRDPSAAPAAVVCRAQFLRDEHWVANVAPHGGRNREYRLEGPFAAPEARYVVVAYVFPSDVRAWPDATHDDALNLELLQGALPERLSFATERWRPIP
jgi:hypothetical protein